MSNLLISAIIIVFCLVVVVGAANAMLRQKKRNAVKQLKDFEIQIVDRTAELEQIKAVSTVLKDWAARINMQDEDSALKMEMQNVLQEKIDALRSAIETEDYESAAQLRDDINKLKVELKKLLDENK